MNRKHPQEGRHRLGEVHVVFDWKQQRATYTNRDRRLDPIPLPPGTFEMNAIYLLTLPI